MRFTRWLIGARIQEPPISMPLADALTTVEAAM